VWPRCSARNTKGPEASERNLVLPNAYLTDLQILLAERWLRPGALVVADNVKFPGAPAYQAYMIGNEGKRWRTTEHPTHVEYQSLIKDLVLVSELIA
jgi:catechol O-methyltransferase